ncbi:hypothetical protein PRIPAC_90614 [Pristionchus pacificus]|uniref:Uncharacterized protein n=1 Tax=Pristionchus pacificus TaxID=54126 RepID=A0A2A6B858_PRIPA|nr:hypothetical protein PRIPAC_90614 [Pristionchus pacificus]|eukprot:PDM62051.1 hypothetical protein PRIPAC_51493 [Pristionchus pacificus]
MKILLLVVGLLAVIAFADGSNRVAKRNALFFSKLHRKGRMQKFEQTKVNDAKTNVEIAQTEAKSDIVSDTAHDVVSKEEEGKRSGNIADVLRQKGPLLNITIVKDTISKLEKLHTEGYDLSTAYEEWQECTEKHNQDSSECHEKKIHSLLNQYEDTRRKRGGARRPYNHTHKQVNKARRTIISKRVDHHISAKPYYVRWTEEGVESFHLYEKSKFDKAEGTKCGEKLTKGHVPSKRETLHHEARTKDMRKRLVRIRNDLQDLHSLSAQMLLYANAERGLDDCKETNKNDPEVEMSCESTWDTQQMDNASETIEAMIKDASDNI